VAAVPDASAPVGWTVSNWQEPMHSLTDVDETDKLQKLLATCCSGWRRRRRRRRTCSAHHAAFAAAAVPGVYLEHACRNAERRRPDEAWNRGFAALVGRNRTSVWCAIESLQQDAAATSTTLLPATHLKMSIEIPQRQLHTICAAPRDGYRSYRRRWKRPCVRSHAQSASSESDSDTLL